jgi:hypothetical protein
MGGLLDWIFGESPRQYERPSILPWPSKEEVDAARDYKRRFGNINEQMVDAPHFQDQPHGNVRTMVPGTPMDTIDAQHAIWAVNKQRLSDMSSGDPLNQETADRLYAAQLAAQRSPMGYLGFDANKMAVTQFGDQGPTLNAGGAFLPSKDRIWADMREPGANAPVHEAYHRAFNELRQAGLLTGEAETPKNFEETAVRALMQRNHGDVERRPDLPPDSAGNRQVDSGAALARNQKNKKYFDRLDELANQRIATGLLARGPL